MLGVQTWGGYVQYMTLPATNTHLLPDGLDFSAATVVARHAPLAFNQLKTRANVQPGEWVLVMGAAGGLGSASVQVAKYLGARVIAAAGSDERAKTALALGADATINYRAMDLALEARRITEGRGVDIVLENIGDKELFPKAFASLGRNGRLVTAGAHAGGTVQLDLHHLYLNYITIIGSPSHTDRDVEMSLELAAAGHLKPLIDRELPLAEAAAAHRLVEERAGLGKVVLKPWASRR
jgi:NADPH:quinone reductase-like Zn-dependent oxidoreductase